MKQGAQNGHLCSPETRAKISAALKGNKTLSEAVKSIHQRRIASGEDAIIREKIRQTRIASGDWLATPLSEFQEYRKAIRQVTNAQPIHSLQHFESRGRGTGRYHLDHIVSCKSGFEHGLPAEVIGNIENLRFISERENCSKQGYNDIDEITNLYFRLSTELQF